MELRTFSGSILSWNNCSFSEDSLRQSVSSFSSFSFSSLRVFLNNNLPILLGLLIKSVLLKKNKFCLSSSLLFSIHDKPLSCGFLPFFLRCLVFCRSVHFSGGKYNVDEIPVCTDAEVLQKPHTSPGYIDLRFQHSLCFVLRYF